MARTMFLCLLVIFAPANLAAQELDFEQPPFGSFESPSIQQDMAVQGVDHRVVVANGQAESAYTAALSSDHNALRPFDSNQDQESKEQGLGILNLATTQLQNIDWQKMLLSLGVVIGGYLGLMFLLRTLGNGTGGALPREVVEVLGTAPLNSKQNLQLVRLGSKLLLLLHGPDGTHSLGEISNPHEVEHLAQVCCSRRGRRVPTAFKKFSVNHQAETAPTPPLDALLRSLQTTLQRGPARTEYEA